MSEDQSSYGKPGVEKTFYENCRPHSVEVSRNAKGEVALSVKAYEATLEEAGDKAVAEFNRLKKLLGLA